MLLPMVETNHWDKSISISSMYDQLNITVTVLHVWLSDILNILLNTPSQFKQFKPQVHTSSGLIARGGGFSLTMWEVFILGKRNSFEQAVNTIENLARFFKF